MIYKDFNRSHLSIAQSFLSLYESVTQTLSYLQSYLLPDDERTHNTRSQVKEIRLKHLPRGHQHFAHFLSLLQKRVKPTIW